MRHRAFPLLATLVAIVLVLGSLRVGLQLDDFYERWIILGSPAFSDVGRKPIDAFCFCDGDSTRNRRMIERGLLPWWIDPHVKAAFWKPATVLTHMVDYHFWPDSPGLMHVQSIGWFGLWVLSACLLYRRIMRATLAGALAGLLYAIDHSRAIPVGWLANRNAVLAGLFGILAIYSYDLWRRGGRSGARVLSVILLAMSLLCAEAGMGAAGYLLAYGLTLDRARWRAGILRLWPHLLIIVAWRIAWSAQGYGVCAMDGMYVDPAAHPVRFLQLVLERAPLYMLGQWTAIPAEIHLGLAWRGVLVMWCAGVAVSVLGVVVLIPLLRRSRVARFWAVGMLLSTVPICSAAPMNRHLIFIGLGAMGLLGQFLAASLDGKYWRGAVGRRICKAVLIGTLIFIHMVLAPIALAVLARYPVGPDDLLDRFHKLPVTPGSGCDIVFVNHPLPMDVLHLWTGRAVDRAALPRSAQILAPASGALHLFRVDDTTLLLRSDSGFFSFASGLGYDREHPLLKGQILSLPAMRITIVEMNPDGSPAAVLYRFNVPLEDASLQWICWKSGQFEIFTPPAVGRDVWVPASGLPF